MGCDWYSIIQINAIGFIKPVKNDLDLKDILNQIKDQNVEILIFSKLENGKISNFVFICEPKSLIVNELSVPGPYEIALSDHSTKIRNEKSYSSIFEKELKNFDQIFLNEGSNHYYYSILTSMGVGIIGKSQQLKSFKSISDYNDYHGYEK